MSTQGIPYEFERSAEEAIERLRWLERAPTFTGSMLGLGQEEAARENLPRVGQPWGVGVESKIAWSVGSLGMVSTHPGTFPGVALATLTAAWGILPTTVVDAQGVVANWPHLVEARRLEQVPTNEGAAWVRVIRNLIEKDRVAEARQMTEKIPRSALVSPELVTLKRVLAPPRTRTKDIRSLDRSREVAWLTEHEHEYRGKWVAIHLGVLVGVADSLRDLLAELELKPLAERPLIHRIPPKAHA